MPLLPLVTALLLCIPLRAQADPGYYLVTVYENEGERNIDFRYWTVKQPGRAEVIWPEIGFGYGVTKRWYTELFVSYIGNEITTTYPSTWNWQNDYLLTQGQYPFDLAVHTNLYVNQGSNPGYALEIGPALQTEIGRTQFNANLIFERSFGFVPTKATQLKYQWQVKHRYHPLFEFGLQGFGELGDWDNWSAPGRQSHRGGPMIGGTLALKGTEAIKYQLSYLAGSVYGSKGNMLSLRVQYVF